MDDKIGNQTRVGTTADAVVYDDSQLSRDEALAANPNAAPEPPELLTTWLQRQPVLAALVAANGPLILSFVTSLTANNVPDEIRIALGVAILVLNVAVAAARKAVTPIADPKLDAEIPLVPATTVE